MKIHVKKSHENVKHKFSALYGYAHLIFFFNMFSISLLRGKKKFNFTKVH
jgi:hypothetical protein